MQQGQPVTQGAIAAELAACLEVAYTTMDPIARREAIGRVEALQQCGPNTGVTHQQLAGAALSILQRADVSLATRAYGATILRQLMLTHQLSAGESHYEDIVAWVVSADEADDCYAGRMASPLRIAGPLASPSIHRLVAGSCSLLVGTAASLTWPQSAADLIPRLCGPDGALAGRPNCQRMLLEVCRACCEPAYATLPKARIGGLRKAVKEASPAIVAAAVGALGRQYAYVQQIIATAEGLTAAATSEAAALRSVCEDMAACVEVLSLAARTCEPMLDALWGAGVDSALAALVLVDGRAAATRAEQMALPPAACAAIAETVGRVPLMALDACVAIIGNVPKEAVLPKDPANIGPHHAETLQRLASFCANVVSTMATFVHRREYEAVARLVEITAKSASLRHILAAAEQHGCARPLSAALLGASVHALHVPDVALATDVCEAISDRLHGAIDARAVAYAKNGGNATPTDDALLAGFEPDRCLLQLSRLAIRDHFNAWTPLVPRHSPQDCEYQLEGRRLSEATCDSEDSFMATHSQLRSAMAPLCAAIAALYPATARQFVAHLLAKLTSPAPQDPKTPTGNVTQRSATYATWDSVEYLVGCVLAPCVFSRAANPTDGDAASWLAWVAATCQDTYNAVFSANTSDATLAPVFMNLLQGLWCVCLPSTEFMFAGIPKRVQTIIQFRQILGATAASGVATEAIVYLFSFMRKLPTAGHILADPDLVSARKRSMTLLIRFCASFAPGLCGMDLATGHAVAKHIKSEAERSLVADKVLPSERSLLNEALAGLTNVMSADDAEASTKSLLGPSVDTLRAVGGSVTPESLAFLLCDDSKASHSQREALRDSVSTLTAVLRRSPVSPFTTQIATTVIPLLGNVTITVHGLKANHLPPDFVGILDSTDDEQKQAMINGSGVRRPPDLTNRIGNTRRYLAALRIALYQGIALLPRFLPVECFTEGISQILVGAEHFATPTMRDLCEQCLFPVTAECPSLIAVTLRALRGFLSTRSSARATEKQQIVDSKQLMYFSKDIATYIRATLLEGRRYQDIVRGPPLEGPSFQSNAMALTASASATYPFAAEPVGVELFVSAVCGLLVWGGDVRSAAYLAIAGINHLSQKDPSMTTYGSACAALFATTCAASVVNPSMDRQSTRDYLLAMLADLYVHHYPFFASALVLEGDHVLHALGGTRPAIAAVAEMEALHAQLMAVKGPRQKRQCFTDFVVKCLAPR